MANSYDKVTKTLKNTPPTNPLTAKANAEDPIAAVTHHRDEVIVDTEMEARAVAGDIFDPIDTPEEFLNNTYKPR